MKFLRQVVFVAFCLCCLPLCAHNPKKVPPPDPEIDIVYTWVDSSDPAWRRLRAQYSPTQISNDGNAACRFRSRDELKYSLRSVYKYAPYVRKIFIVTNGQKPSWITDHPKICFISHDQIFRDTSHLPTFNSMAIESCLHRIADLSDYYVYFNDDVFLGKSTTFETFFTRSGKIRLFLDEHVISKTPKASPKFGYRSAIKNTDRLLDLTFGTEQRHHHAHTPDPERKSLVTSIEIQFHNIFSQAETHRFRCADDYALTNGLIPYTAFYFGNGEKTEVSNDQVLLKGDPEKEKKDFKRILKDSPQFFCIQDLQEEANSKTDKQLHDFLEEYYPKPGPWEKVVKKKHVAQRRHHKK